MGDKKSDAAVWTGAKPYVQQKDEYLRKGMLRALRDALKNRRTSGRSTQKGASRP